MYPAASAWVLIPTLFTAACAQLNSTLWNSFDIEVFHGGLRHLFADYVDLSTVFESLKLADGFISSPSSKYEWSVWVDSNYHFGSFLYSEKIDVWDADDVETLDEWFADLDSFNNQIDNITNNSMTVMGNMFLCPDNVTECEDLRIGPDDNGNITMYRPMAIHMDTDTNRTVMVYDLEDDWVEVVVFWYFVYTDWDNGTAPSMDNLVSNVLFPGSTSTDHHFLEDGIVANDPNVGVAHGFAVAKYEDADFVTELLEDVGTPDQWSAEGDIYEHVQNGVTVHILYIQFVN